MARVLNRLSDFRVRAKKQPGYVADGGNLYLRVASGGSKGWIFRFSMAGKTRDAGLGPYPAMSLVKAREEAERCRRLVAQGIDPIQARDEERARARAAAAKAVTFIQCAQSFIGSQELGWRNSKTVANFRATLNTYAYPVLGELSVQAIDTGLVLKVLEPIWGEKTATAARLRASIERILNFAKARGHRSGENPAAWRGHLDQLLPAQAKVRPIQHHPALPYGVIPTFMGQVRGRNGIAARALEFMILMASRIGEALGARWDEIDLAAKLWIIPKERMKSGKEHRVPLAPRAIAIVEAMAELRINEFVFPGAKQGRPLSDTGIRALVRELGVSVTRHGFRSTFRDWAAETTGFPNHVVEMALAHAVSDAVEAAYRRGDLLEKRRKLMEAWAAYCERKPAEVVQLKGRAAGASRGGAD
jgi:integrase